MSLSHPLGTDQLGRDMLARLMAGGRASVAVGAAAMLISLLVGGLAGLLAGFVRWLDGPLMRLTDLFLALPLLPLLLVVILLFRDALRTAFGPEAGIFILMVGVMGITGWMQTARVVRGEVLTVKEREFVVAARALGVPEHLIARGHVLPNVLSPIMVSATLGMANAIITESGALPFSDSAFPRISDMGPSAVRCHRLSAAISGPGSVARPGGLSHRAVGQLHGRRPPRLARSAHTPALSVDRGTLVTRRPPRRSGPVR